MPHRSGPAAVPVNGHAKDVKPASWQARKSASTRLQIVEATLRCFSKLGYFRTTTPAIAAEAGLSRGAMLHHFPSRKDVVRAAIEHLHAKRLKAFRIAVEQLSPGSSRAHGALRAHWQQLSHPLYAVFLELYVAARTDPELAAILAPAEEAFVRELRATAADVVPEWRDRGRNFDLGYDLVICALQGMALSMLRHRTSEPSQDLLRYLEERVDELAGQPVAPPPSNLAPPDRNGR
jgi:AcrR family transcriptional regulator